MSQTTLDYLDDEHMLSVRYESTDYSQPVRRVLWWPILRLSKSDSLLYALGAPLRDLTEGRYQYHFTADVPEAARRLVFRLPDGGRTQAVKALEEPLPAPKVRRGIEVRWANGRWEKYLKAQGWVAA